MALQAQSVRSLKRALVLLCEGRKYKCPVKNTLGRFLTGKWKAKARTGREWKKGALWRLLWVPLCGYGEEMGTGGLDEFLLPMRCLALTCSSPNQALLSNSSAKMMPVCEAPLHFPFFCIAQKGSLHFCTIWEERST